jgi:hypothetical protein
VPILLRHFADERVRADAHFSGARRRCLDRAQTHRERDLSSFVGA